MNDSSRRPKASIVVPVFNERARIEEIPLQVQAVAPEKEILIIDDGSTDGARQFLAELAAQTALKPPATTQEVEELLFRNNLIQNGSACGINSQTRGGAKWARTGPPGPT